MPAKIKNEFGTIVIRDTVIANIACNAAMETYGIVGLSAKNPVDGIFELLGFENMTKGVKIEIDEEENTVDIDIAVIMEYGVRIAVVAENLIDKVKFNVETNTGLHVNSINIVVRGIRV